LFRCVFVCSGLVFRRLVCCRFVRSRVGFFLAIACGGAKSTKNRQGHKKFFHFSNLLVATEVVAFCKVAKTIQAQLPAEIKTKDGTGGQEKQTMFVKPHRAA
jgi:hypothetical protein